MAKRGSNRRFREIQQAQAFNRQAAPQRQHQVDTQTSAVSDTPELQSASFSDSGRRTWWYEDDRKTVYEFFMVQPLVTGTALFGGRFGLHKMAETGFTPRTLSKSLLRLSELGNFDIESTHAYRDRGGRREVFCVGPVGGLHRKAVAFREWVVDPGITHGYTGFFQAYGGGGMSDGRKIAWWSLDVDMFWTLNPVVAEELCYGLNLLRR